MLTFCCIFGELFEICYTGTGKICLNLFKGFLFYFSTPLIRIQLELDADLDPDRGRTIMYADPKH